MSPRSSTLRKPPRKQVAMARVEGRGRAFMRGTIAGTIDEAQDFASVGQGDDQGMITPDAVVGDVHALFALAGGGHQGAVGVEDGLVEETGGLVLPDADADLIEDVLQEVDVGHGEASAKIAGGSGVGNALGAEGIEKVDIVAAQFDVLQTIAVTQGVEGEVEHMIGFGIGQMNLENVQTRIDGVEQADVAGELVKEGDAAEAEAMDAVGDFIVEVAAGQDRPRLLGKLGLVEAALDFALAGGQLSA